MRSRAKNISSRFKSYLILQIFASLSSSILISIGSISIGSISVSSSISNSIGSSSSSSISLSSSISSGIIAVVALAKDSEPWLEGIF